MKEQNDQGKREHSLPTSHERKQYWIDYIKVQPNVKYDVIDRNLLKSYSFRMNFWYENKFYKIRPKGNPLPLIVEELQEMLGDFEKARDTMDNFFRACANLYDKGKYPFAVIIEDFIPNKNTNGWENSGSTSTASTVEYPNTGAGETIIWESRIDTAS